MRRVTFCLLSVSPCDRIKHKALVRDMPPIYHSLVFPSPIYMSAADFKLFSFNDLASPKMPFNFIYLDILIFRVVAKAKLNIFDSFAE